MVPLKGKMLNKVFFCIQVELVLKINYPNGRHNMASKKACGKPLSQGVGSPYKTNNEHYFYYQHLFSARFFLHIFVCRILFSKLNQIPDQISNQNISRIQGNYDKQTITSWEILIF